ncbi:GAF domain-containing protein [Xanthomonas arboricola]|uniref:diguanylate cyclase domain-containing protein n=1 Tax=Xanthomonas euroxanthea TaxID=2259622 RepID=UPI00141B00C3|nr:diguanylate cyclase [Xanthomonas euroxanthea]MBB3814780.1 GAF domain-containing protein [Xanthomonas euroxanthea]NIK37941.1 GAF domain-containing protein [Xanthomonas euroxanthea]
MPGALKNQLPFTSTSETVDEVLGCLAQLTPLRTWVFAEVKNDYWIIRACTDSSFGLKVDQFISWSESVCRRVISRGGPQCAPDLSKIDHLAGAPIAIELGISSYLGVPIKIPSQMEGMLCGIDTRIVDGELSHFLPVAETFGRVLASCWAQHLYDTQPPMQDVQTVDVLTGLYDLTAFQSLLENATELQRDEQGGVLLFDLDVSSAGKDAGKRKEIEIAASLLKAATRPQDVLAHLSRGEFAIYLPGISETGMLSVARRIRSSLAGRGLKSKWGASWLKNMDQLDNIDRVLKRASAHSSGTSMSTEASA